ncbi:hypothetical protein HMPREF3224_02643, partial [Anaerococcus hydrogenalis]
MHGKIAENVAAEDNPQCGHRVKRRTAERARQLRMPFPQDHDAEQRTKECKER